VEKSSAPHSFCTIFLPIQKDVKICNTVIYNDTLTTSIGDLIEKGRPKTRVFEKATKVVKQIEGDKKMLSLVPFRSKSLRHSPFAIDRFFDDPFFFGFDESRRDWNPAVEIVESDDEIMLTAELPGLEEKDIHINVEENLLSLTGERTFEKKEEGDYLRSERWYGKFSRSFRLPETADVEKISAKLKNGVLIVTVPKKEEAKPRQIEVKVN
jgi:HSP20 family protein